MNETQLRIVALALAALLAAVALRLRDRARAADRLRGRDVRAEKTKPSRAGLVALSGWLRRAGFGGRTAPARFVAAAALAAAGGVLGFVAVTAAGIPERLALGLGGVPVLGSALAPALVLVPALVAISIAVLPWSLVGQARARRVRAIEADLPVALELLSTLAEAGLGLDAALARVREALGHERPLAAELLELARESGAGAGRVEALERLAARTRVPALNAVVSAWIQAEVLGSAVAPLLRQQALEQRIRRRERELAHAEALASKLVVPLALCFLPALFAWTLGPALYQMIQVIDSITGSAR